MEGSYWHHNRNYTQTITLAQSIEDLEQLERQQEEDLHNLEISELEASTNLYYSALDHSTLQVSTNATQSALLTAPHITYFQNIVQATQLLLAAGEIVKNENTTLTATGYTLLGALGALYSGNLFTGLTLGATAVNEIRKIIERAQREGLDVSTLLTRTEASVAMIKQLEAYQQNSLETIKGQINDVKEQISQAQTELEAIEKFQSTYSKQAEKEKEVAYQLATKSVWAYKQSLEQLDSSNLKLQNSQEKMKRVVTQVKELIEMVEKGNLSEESLSDFLEKAQSILDQMVKIQAEIDTSQKSFQSASNGLHQASNDSKQALNHFARALKFEETAVHAIKVHEQITKLENMKKGLNEATDEVSTAEKRAENLRELVEYAEEQLKKAEEKNQENWGNLTMLVGGTATAVTAAANPILAVPTGAATAAIFHRTRFLRRILNEYYLKDAPPPLPKEVGGITVQYNSVSTGYYGWISDMARKYMGYDQVGSKTAGMIAINIGENKPALYHFDKNSQSPNGMMNEEDMKKLNDDLRKVKDKIGAESCLEILNGLATVATVHGNVSFVAFDSLYLKDLRNELEKESKPGQS